MGDDWAGKVEAMAALLVRGDEVARMEQVTGEEGISIDDFVASEAAHFLDTLVFLPAGRLRPDRFLSPIERQRDLFERVHRICTHAHGFADKDAARQHFTRLAGLFKNYNYAAPGSPDAERTARGDRRARRLGVTPVRRRRHAQLLDLERSTRSGTFHNGCGERGMIGRLVAIARSAMRRSRNLAARTLCRSRA